MSETPGPHCELCLRPVSRAESERAARIIGGAIGPEALNLCPECAKGLAEGLAEDAE